MQVPAGTAPLTRPARALRLLLVGAVVVLADQATKTLALRTLDHPVDVVGSFVRLEVVRNPGGAFSLFTGMAPFLAVGAIVLALVILRLGSREHDAVLLVALGLVLGGALGNLADRVFRDPGLLHGAVVDFVDIGAWPTFNLADVGISVGAVLVVLRGWRS